MGSGSLIRGAPRQLSNTSPDRLRACIQSPSLKCPGKKRLNISAHIFHLASHNIDHCFFTSQIKCDQYSQNIHCPYICLTQFLFFFFNSVFLLIKNSAFVIKQKQCHICFFYLLFFKIKGVQNCSYIESEPFISSVFNILLRKDPGGAVQF